MALVSNCMHCNKEVCHRASELPLCNDCNGTNAAKAAEQARWKALSVEEKLDELKAAVDSLRETSNRSHWDEVIG